MFALVNHASTSNPSSKITWYSIALERSVSSRLTCVMSEYFKLAFRKSESITFAHIKLASGMYALTIETSVIPAPSKRTLGIFALSKFAPFKVTPWN